MKIPNSIRITSRVSYQVVWVEGFELDGECCSDSRQIRIRMGMSEKLTLETLIHEILHALEFEHKIPIPHKVIHQLEGAVLRVLKLNGWLKPNGRQ